MNDTPKPVSQHLVELRKRVTFSVLAVVVGMMVAFVFHKPILRLLQEPAPDCGGALAGKLIFTEPTEFIGVAFKVSLLAGFAMALPFVLLQIVLFVAPGLTGTERRYLFGLLPVSLVAFALGAAFGYFVLFPPAFKFLCTFGSDVATPLIRIGSYTNLMVTLLFWMGVVFETPVVLFFLSRIGVVSYSQLSRWRKYAVVVAFILGAIITPTLDPVNQTIVALPIIVLYEVGIWLARFGGRGRRRAE